MSFYGGVSVELRPHKQRETVPIGLVELSPYRVNLTSVGWRRIAHTNRRRTSQLVGPLTSPVSPTRGLAMVHALSLIDEVRRARGRRVRQRVWRPDNPSAQVRLVPACGGRLTELETSVRAFLRLLGIRIPQGSLAGTNPNFRPWTDQLEPPKYLESSDRKLNSPTTSATRPKCLGSSATTAVRVTEYLAQACRPHLGPATGQRCGRELSLERCLEESVSL